jgi:hypothetical protein
MMGSSGELAIARSVIYASLFDYPLTLQQLHQTLLESDQTAQEILATYASSEMLQAIVEYREGFFFPRGRRDLLTERRLREARSCAFLARHRRLLTLVCAVPYVRMVALSGSIAHLNLEGGGDLDLFIVTRGRRVWTVTLAVLILARLMRQRRIVCANFVVADSQLALEQQDLFTANQVIHLRPLVGASLFQELLSANPFVARFYPNFERSERGAFPFQLNLTRHRAPGTQRPEPGTLLRLKTALEAVLGGPSRIVELACRHAYGSYLRRRAGSWPSPEQVRLRADCLKLHTRSHRRSILNRYECAVREAIERAGERTPTAVG